MTRALPFLATVAAGVLLAVTSYSADHVSYDGSAPDLLRAGFARLGNAPSPWILAAFVVGAIAGRPFRGAAAAVVALALGVAGYYLLIDYAGEREGINLQRVAVAWAAVGAACGVVFGAAGGAWRSAEPRLKFVSAALLGGALGGIGLYVVLDLAPYWPADRRGVLLGAAHLIGGLIIAAALVRRPMERLAVFAVSAALSTGGAACMVLVLEQMRDRFNA